MFRQIRLLRQWLGWRVPGTAHHPFFLKSLINLIAFFQWQGGFESDTFNGLGLLVSWVRWLRSNVRPGIRVASMCAVRFMSTPCSIFFLRFLIRFIFHYGKLKLSSTWTIWNGQSRMRHSRLSARTPKDEEISIPETKLGFCFSCVIFRRAFASPFFLHFEPLCLCWGMTEFERRLRIFWSELIDRVRVRWFLLLFLWRRWALPVSAFAGLFKKDPD